MSYLLEGFLRAGGLLVSGDPETYSAVSATLRVSAMSLGASLILGIPAGFALGYLTFPYKRFVRTVVDTLLALPTVFIGLMVYALITRRGPLGEWDLLFTLRGIAAGQTILAVPIVVALTATAVESLDPRLRVNVLALGANRRQVFFTTIWEARHAVTAGAVTACGRVMTEVGISMMVGGNIKWHTRTITTAIALETNKGRFDSGVALGIVLLGIAFAVNLLVSLLRQRSGA